MNRSSEEKNICFRGSREERIHCSGVPGLITKLQSQEITLAADSACSMKCGRPLFH